MHARERCEPSELSASLSQQAIDLRTDGSDRQNETYFIQSTDRQSARCTK